NYIWQFISLYIAKNNSLSFIKINVVHMNFRFIFLLSIPLTSLPLAASATPSAQIIDQQINNC
ncbi:hypothetical protein J4727_13335, partial [Providencia rettgeri]|nr:hypothetical protein [Providencia rettgeri]